MLVHQIATRVQGMTEDPDYWNQTRITVFINQCKDSISSHFGLLANGYILMNSVVSQRSYSLPLDFVALKMLYWSSGNYLVPANRVNSPEEVLKYTSTPSETGVPEKYYLWGKEDHVELWLWPTFDTVYELEFWYWRRIPDVVNSNDEVMIPRDLHDKMVEYCRRQIWVEDESKNYTPERFDAWWLSELTQMQIAKNVQLAGSDHIGPGDFDDRMPPVNDGAIGFGFHINTGDDVQW